MKKTRGKKKKVSHPKKVNNFFIFKNKVAPLVLALVFLALAIVLPFITTGNAVNSSVTGKASFMDNAPSLPGYLDFLNIGNTWRDIIVYIIVLVIIFATLLDILLLTSIFSGWVCFIIALGFSIIASMINIVRQLSVYIISFSAQLGLVAGFIEIVISIIVFAGLIFASPKIAEFAERRKAQRQKIRAIGGAGKVGGAIAGLKAIQKELKHNT